MQQSTTANLVEFHTERKKITEQNTKSLNANEDQLTIVGSEISVRVGIGMIPEKQKLRKRERSIWAIQTQRIQPDLA